MQAQSWHGQNLAGDETNRYPTNSRNGTGKRKQLRTKCDPEAAQCKTDQHLGPDQKADWLRLLL